MRDSATGRSRGFGFLTFRDPKTVNTVMVKEHYLDGKIVRTTTHSQLRSRSQVNTSQIDPKRAIPRDEQEKTSKIFVGGVSQEANEQDFKSFFMQFGRVVDATLMIDKDTGRPRGFGFVTFDSEAAVEAALSRPLEILGKPIEVKKAQPRGNLRDDDGGRNRRGNGFREGSQAGGDGSQQQGGQGQGGMPGGMTPQMMAQYWQRMQQYFTLMQQQMAVAAAQGQGGMGMGGMNPAMMQQMQMKQMQQMQQMSNSQQQGSMSPPSQSSTPQMQNMMNPAMMQQMQQMQQMQNQPQQAGNAGMGGQMANMGGNSPTQMGGNYGQAARGGPGYNAHEQIAFEQQKYEQQQVRRAMENRGFSPYQQGGPTSWEGMYDEVPQPNIPTGPQAMNRAGSMGRGMCYVLFPVPLACTWEPPSLTDQNQEQRLNPRALPPPMRQQAPRTLGSPGQTTVVVVVVATGASIRTLGKLLFVDASFFLPKLDTVWFILFIVFSAFLPPPLIDFCGVYIFSFLGPSINTEPCLVCSFSLLLKRSFPLSLFPVSNTWWTGFAGKRKKEPDDVSDVLSTAFHNIAILQFLLMVWWRNLKYGQPSAADDSGQAKNTS